MRPRLPTSGKRFFTLPASTPTSKETGKDGHQKECMQNGAKRNLQQYIHGLLVGGFNPFEKYSSKWESSPSMDENKKYLKPPTRLHCHLRELQALQNES